MASHIARSQMRPMRSANEFRILWYTSLAPRKSIDKVTRVARLRDAEVYDSRTGTQSSPLGQISALNSKKREERQC